MLLGRLAYLEKRQRQRGPYVVDVACETELASEKDTSQVYIGVSPGSILRVPSPKMVGDIATEVE